MKEIHPVKLQIIRIGGLGFGAQGSFEVSHQAMPMPSCIICGKDGPELTSAGRGPYCAKHVGTMGRHRPRRCLSHTDRIFLKRLRKQSRPVVLQLERVIEKRVCEHVWEVDGDRDVCKKCGSRTNPVI